MSDTQELAFASEFPAATREQWLKLVDGVLKGAPFDKRLVARTYDGVAIQPLYDRAADARPVAARAPGAPWTVMQRVDHPDPAAANEQALRDLENGATGLTIVCRGSVNANGYGLDASLETHGGVEMGWRQRNGHVEVWIDDEGPGLANTTNLFVPFFTTKAGGSGIGLVLSRQIAEAHGGTLTLENRSRVRGCEARLRLPL